MARYRLVNAQTIYDTQINATIPTDGSNADYQNYLAWVADGNAADPPLAAPLRYDEDGKLQGRVTTSNATATELLRATLPLMTGYLAHLRLIGVDLGNGALYALQGYVTVKRLSGGAIIVGQDIGTPMRDTPATDTWAVTNVISGNDYIIRVTGAAGRNISWSVNGTYISFSPNGR